jgi:glycosyltransferase involved in cell wall biosynthesis
MPNKNLILFMPSIEVGGVEKNLFIISNYLGKKIPNSILITGSKSFNSKFKNLKVINPKINIENFSFKRLKFLFCIIELIKLFLKKKNYLVFSFQANLYCALICRIFGVKVIVRSNSSPSGWDLGFFRKIIFYYFLKLPNKIIVNSKEFKKEYKKRFNITTKYIYNPLNKDYINKISNEKIKNNFFKNFKKIKIIFIGRLVEQKDPMTFVRALNLLKNKINFRAIIIGRGYYQNSLNKFLSENLLKNKVKMIKWQNNPYKFLKASDVLVLTSKFEGLPNILLEAICLKKHVISSDCPTGPREILDNGKGGSLFEMGNFKQLSTKILKLNKYKKEYNDKKKFAYKRLIRFDYKKNLDKYLQEVKNEMY